MLHFPSWLIAQALHIICLCHIESPAAMMGGRSEAEASLTYALSLHKFSLIFPGDRDVSMWGENTCFGTYDFLGMCKDSHDMDLEMIIGTVSPNFLLIVIFSILILVMASFVST